MSREDTPEYKLFSGKGQINNEFTPEPIDPTYLISPDFFYVTALSAEPKGDCGKMKTFSCEKFTEPGDGHEFFQRPNTCRRITCQECGDREIKRQAGEIIRRAKAMVREARRQGYQLPENINDGKYWVHATLRMNKNERPRFLNRKGYTAERQKAERYFQRLGFIGGYVFLHLVGGSPQEIQDWQAGRIQLEFDPHWHIWGCRPSLGMPTDLFHKKTGAVFVAFYDWKHRYRNVFKTLIYELGHASAPVNGDTGKHGQISSPFGVLHPYYLNCKKTEEKEQHRCRFCGGEMRDEEGRPIMKRKEIRKYSIPEARACRIEAKYGVPRGQINPYPSKVVYDCQATI